MRNKPQKKGFTLVEIVVAVGIMVTLAGVLAPVFIGYVEKSRANEDTSVMGEVTSAIELAMAQQNVYDDLMMYALESNFSCYADGDPNTNTPENKVKDYNVGPPHDDIESNDWWHYNDNARMLDSVVYQPSGNMSGVTITFSHRTEAGHTNEMAINNGLVNNMSASTKKSNATFVKDLSTDTQTYLYDCIRPIVTDNVETCSRRYKNSEYTVFIRMLPLNADYDIYQDTTVTVYGQWNGMNLQSGDSRDPEQETKGVDAIVPVPDNPLPPTVPQSPTIDPTPQIPRDPSTYIQEPTAKDLTYNGNPQILVNAGATDHGIIQYRVADGDWSSDLPTGTDAGTYEVHYYIKGDKFHYNSAERAVTVTIKKANPVFTEPEGRDLIANDMQQELAIAGNVAAGGVMYYRLESGSYSTNVPKEKEPGEYNIYWYVKGEPSNNYNDSPEKSFVSTITGIPSINPLPEAVDLTYNGKFQTLIKAGGTKGGTLYYKTTGDFSTALPQGKDAGEYTVTYYVKGHKYWENSEESTVTVTIKKATPSVTPPTAQTLTYTGKPQTLARPGSTTGGTLQYSLDKSTWSTAVPSGTKAGTYTVWYRVIGDKNHNDIAPTSISVTIKKDIPIVTVIGDTGLTYNGTSQNLLSTHSSSGGTLHYRVGLNGTWSTTPPTATDAGTYAIYYYAEETGNFEGYMSESSPGSTTASITKKTVPIAKAPSVAGDDWYYDGSTHTVTPNGAEWSITYSEDNIYFSSVLPTRTNAGKTTVYWKASHKNYLDCNGISYLICNKAAPSYSPPTGKNLPYSGKPQKLITAGSVDNGTMYYRLSTSDTWSTELPTATVPGIYTVNYYIEETENYRGTSESGVVSTIYPEKAPDSELPVIDGKTWGYDGNAYGVTASNADGWTIEYSTNKDTGYTTTSPTLTDVGQKTVYWKATHALYSSISGSAILKCTPAKMTVTVRNGSTEYYGSPTTGGARVSASSSATTFNPTIKYGTSPSNCTLSAIPTYTDIGIYIVYYTVTAPNHDSESGSLTININKIQPRISVTPGGSKMTLGEIKTFTIRVTNKPSNVPLLYRIERMSGGNSSFGVTSFSDRQITIRCNDLGAVNICLYLPETETSAGVERVLAAWCVS